MAGYLDDYFEQNERWLAMEADAERERLAQRRASGRRRDPERSGETIIGLLLQDYKNGMAGRLLLELGKPGSKTLPMTRLKVGSPVIVSDDTNPSDAGKSGVISRRTSNSIQVALDDWPEAERYRLDLSPDETTRRRQMTAMAAARRQTGSRARLRDVLLGQQEPRFDPPKEFDFANQGLNAPQQEAVRFAMTARDLAILHGPPGTGKTTTVVEVIAQTVRQGGRVLACAPSNTAVDNLLERLVGMVPSVLRVGHPARVFEKLRDHTLDERVQNDSSTAVVKEIWRDVDDLMRRARKQSQAYGANRRKGELYAEAGKLRQQARSLEKATIRNIVESADVICTTTTLDTDLLGYEQFDLVVIDEACQCVEPALWQAALVADKVLLAGDHLQLPPTVVSKEAAREGYIRSSMQRLIEHYGSEFYRRLKVQYRMHEDIMEFSSQEFYDGDLIADQSVAKHRITDLPSVRSDGLTSTGDAATSSMHEVLQFWDTAGAEWEEQIEEHGESKFNRKEATWVVNQVRELLDLGVAPQDIGVIAPYAAQAKLLRNRLDIEGLEIDTVDGFQGREKEAMIITFTRSNTEGEIGFLADTRRSNVALTRAKRWLRMVGDSATLATDEFYERLIEHYQTTGAYHSVWETGEA